jgi:hypothetical protein
LARLATRTQHFDYQFAGGYPAVSRIIGHQKFERDTEWRVAMAKKTIHISDMSGDEIPDGKGASVRITYHDARKGVRELDLTDAEAEKLGGRPVARRGRKPKIA